MLDAAFWFAAGVVACAFAGVTFPAKVRALVSGWGASIRSLYLGTKTDTTQEK